MKGLRDKFRSQREKLMNRHLEQVESVNEKFTRPTIFDLSKVPEGRGFWYPKKGDHLIDIIPFFAGNQHPRVSEGDASYVVDLYIHPLIGPKYEPFVCQTKNFNGTDPICEYLARNRLPTEEWKKFSPKRRTVYLVWVHDTPEEEAKGIQIWEVAHWFFETHVDEISKSPRGGGAIVFSDLDQGKSIAFSIKSAGKFRDDSGAERDSVSYVGHRFVDRDEPIPDRIVDQSFSLDEIIKMHPSAKEVAEALSFMIDAPIKRSSFTKPSRTKEEDIDIPDENDEDEEEETENEVEDDVEETDEGSEDASECPYNNFGIGFDKHTDCTFCDLYDECGDKAESLKKEAPKDKTKKLRRK
jgi:protein-tyrosine-phosphatase